jgi:hypothetical protein
MAGNLLIAEIPLGLSGLNGNRNQSQIPLDSLINADNLTYDSGTLQKEGGAAKLNTTALNAGGGGSGIIGAWDWHPTQSQQRTIVFSNDGILYRSTASAFTSMAGATTLTATGDVVPFFVEGGKEVAANNKKLFIFSGVNPVGVIDGDATTATTLTSGPADWTATNQPAFGLLHVGRLWGGGNLNDPHRLYYSAASDHEQFSSPGGTVAVYPGEGERMVAAVSFKGFILCFKAPRGVYAVDTRDATVANWRVDKLNENIGACGPQSVVVIDNDVLYMDNSAQLHLISRIEDGTFDASNLSQEHDMQDYMKDNFNFARLYHARGVYYYAKREVHIGIAAQGDTNNTRRFVVDFNRPQPRFRVSSRDVSDAVFLRHDSDGVPRLAIGDNDGFVWNLDQDDRTADGSGYAAQWQTPHMDMGHIDPNLSVRRKNGRFLEMVVEPTGNYDLTIDILWDNAASETINFNLGAGAASIGTFILDTDILGGGDVLTKRKRISGSGYRFSMIGRNSGDAQNFSIARMFLHFAPGGTRLE